MPRFNKKKYEKLKEKVFGWTRKVDNKMRAFGETDLKKKTIRINKKKSKKSKPGEVIDTIVHEEMHRKHPKMKEKTVRKKTKSSVGRMSKKVKSKHYSKFK